MEISLCNLYCTLIRIMKMKHFMQQNEKCREGRSGGGAFVANMAEYSNCHTYVLFCVQNGLNQFRVIQHLHYLGDKLVQMFSITDTGCFSRNYGPPSVRHMFWSCPPLSSYWRYTFDAFSFIYKQTISPDFHKMQCIH